MSSWQFLKRHWVMSLIGLVILLTAAVMIIYAVATGEGDEGFLTAKDGRVLKLNKADLPLSCFYAESVREQAPRYEAARNVINTDADVQIFGRCQPWMIKEAFPTKPVRGGLLLHVGTPPEKQKDGVTVSSPFDPVHGGSTLIYQDKETGGIYGSIIYIDPDAPDGLLDKIWIHELGHAAGLAHDRTRDSIMFPVASDRADELSKRDLKRLQEAYQ